MVPVGVPSTAAPVVRMGKGWVDEGALATGSAAFAEPWPRTYAMCITTAVSSSLERVTPGPVMHAYVGTTPAHTPAHRERGKASDHK